MNTSRRFIDCSRFAVGTLLGFAVFGCTPKPHQTGVESLSEAPKGQTVYTITVNAKPAPSTWLKSRVGNSFVKKCEFKKGDSLELTEMVKQSQIDGHVFVKLKAKTLSSGPGESAETKDSVAGGEAPPKEKQPAGEASNFDPTRQFEASAQGAEDPLEPKVCELMEGWIFEDHWDGAVLEEAGQYFPGAYRPVKSCLSANPEETAFGYSRGSRLHAACDIQAVRNSFAPIYAIEDGVVLDAYDFGEGLGCAIEVRHVNFVARYGEISCSQLPGAGRKLTAGKQFARVGNIWVRTDVDMLHLELYRGTASGQLSQPGRGQYSRRSDLYNPTSFLRSIFNNKPGR
jgi:murein DD-endopeptidase MepM/ murein hydrolase activator NlpD